MTAAMIASNSFWKPRRASVEPASSTVSMATSVAQRAVTTKSVVLTRATGTPDLRAARGSPPDAKIQLPKRVRRRIHVARSAIPTNHRISIGMPGTFGVPFGNVSMMPASASHVNSPGKASPEKSGASGLPATASFMPRSCVAPPLAHLRPTSVRPRRMKRNASVTMNDGRPVRIVSCAFITPMKTAKAIATRIATLSGTCQTTSAVPKTRPAKATIDPIDRSNSPPIIRSAAPTARMPSWAAGAMKFTMPANVNMAGLAVSRKKTVTSARPATAPSSGRRKMPVSVDTFFSRSSGLTTDPFCSLARVMVVPQQYNCYPCAIRPVHAVRGAVGR
ncbi:hypothetical protein D9M69_410740 [compost metagenome]